jgi:hypothetical protein
MLVRPTPPPGRRVVRGDRAAAREEELGRSAEVGADTQPLPLMVAGGGAGAAANAQLLIRPACLPNLVSRRGARPSATPSVRQKGQPGAVVVWGAGGRTRMDDR